MREKQGLRKQLLMGCSEAASAAHAARVIASSLELNKAGVRKGFVEPRVPPRTRARAIDFDKSIFREREREP